jgi:hypothetical protein
MQDARQWIVWKSISDGTSAKPRKVPFYVDGTPRRGVLDSPDDQSRFGTYAQAVAVLNSGAYAGLGFALCNGWQGVDLDCLSTRPALNDHMFALCAMTYCEISPNGDGMHAIGYGKSFPSIGSGGDGFEAYSAGRFFTVTGQVMSSVAVSDLSFYIDMAIRPMRATVTPRMTIPRPARDNYDLGELRSALSSISADDRDTWQAVGQALCGLGDAGFELWDEWSATSAKYNPANDHKTWQSFRGDKTGPEAVFAKAQACGWVNPKARKPLDASTVGFGRTTLVASLPAASHRVPAARAINGSRLVMAHAADQIFEGCVWIQSLNQILVPGGDLLDQATFNNRFKKFSFMVDAGNTTKAKTPIDAFLSNQVLDFDQVHDVCFRPDLPPAAIIEDSGRTMVNTWWPINTLRIPGDVTPFTTHIAKLLPAKQDQNVLMAYLAAMVQYPGVKFRWCPVVQGSKGNGKTLISSCIEYALGRKYCHRPNAADISSKFTGWMRNKLCISISEIATHDKQEVLEFLKTLISDDLVEIQKKGSDQYTGENTANFLMFVNPKNAIPTDNDERRYAVMYTAQQSYADIVRDGMGGDYFPNLVNWMKNGGHAHIAHYLATYLIPDELNPAMACHRAPLTSSTDEAIHESLGALEQDILECAESGEPGFRDGWISSTMLARKFEKRGMSARRLATALTRLGYVKHPGLHDGRCNAPVTMPDGNRPRLYVRPDHPSTGSTPADIARMYVAAQSVFGQSVV